MSALIRRPAPPAVTFTKVRRRGAVFIVRTNNRLVEAAIAEHPIERSSSQ